MKFVHLADCHIKVLKNHSQYRKVFEELYQKIRDFNPDYIINCGDTFHNKINISNESILLVSDFLRNLANIAETYVILGNHDLVLKNLSRKDSITPIVENLNHSKLHFIRETSQVELKDNFVLNVFSIIDKKEKWNNIKINKNKINVALYHGQINNCYTDIGWKIASAIEIDIFKGNDYLFAGDIHLKQDISHGEYEEIEIEEEELNEYLKNNWEVVS